MSQIIHLGLSSDFITKNGKLFVIFVNTNFYIS